MCESHGYKGGRKLPFHSTKNKILGSLILCVYYNIVYVILFIHRSDYVDSYDRFGKLVWHSLQTLHHSHCIALI